MGTSRPDTSSRPWSIRRAPHGNRLVRGVSLLGWFAVDYAIAGAIQVRAIFPDRVPTRYRRGDATKPTIVLIPGVYETWLFMKPIADRLNAHGYPVAVVNGLGYNRRPIVDTSRRVARALARRPARNTGRIIVAHSKGGLVGKHMMLTQGDAADLRGMVAVCTPFAGSRYARWLLDPSLRAFLPTDETIVALSRQAGVNSRIVSIYPPVDQHVPDGSALAGARNVEVPVPGHFHILSHPDGIRAVLEGVDQLVGGSTADDAAGADRRSAGGPVATPADAVKDAAKIDVSETPDSH